MKPAPFRFKQFSIQQHRDVFPVGTDGVLLGAWAQLSANKRILDIGTGTGLLALMAAQRSKAEVTGIDVHRASAQLAQANAHHSPWKDRIQIVHQSLTQCAPPHSFDHIVTNPPFFTNQLRSKGQMKDRSRHNHSLPFETLAHQVHRLLDKDGHFSLILPMEEAANFLEKAQDHHLFLLRQTTVATKEQAPPKRMLLTFVTYRPESVEEDSLCIMEGKEYSAAFKALTSAFYLAH